MKQNNQTLITIFTLTAFLALALGMPKDTSAFQKTARASAVITSTAQINTDKRAETLRAFLEQYDSPLIDSADEFVLYADKYNLDWKFVAAIAGVESWFGQRIPENSYNGWGWGVYGGNVHRFASWNEGIQVISESLRTKYMDKWGARNVQEIGSFYAADPNWSRKVTHFMDKIAAFEENQKRTTLSISL